MSILAAALGTKPRRKPADEAPRAKRSPRASAAKALVARAAAAVLLSPDFGRAVVLALSLAGFVAVCGRVRERLADEPSLAVDRRQLALMPLPSFLSERAREDLLALPLAARVSALEPSVVPALARALELVPWVEEVGSVKLDFPADRDLEPTLRFNLRAARPIARIKERGYELFVTRSRRRVPPDRYAATARPLPRIDGLPDEASPERERALDDALAVLAGLDRKGLTERLGLASLAVASRARRDAKTNEIELALSSGARVEWGRAGVEGEERLLRLEAFLVRGPALSQVERLSVSWDEPVYVLGPVSPGPR